MGMRDMYSAISGLEANSTWLDVIGNNISNVNTIAYKASRLEFASTFSQTLNPGQGDNTGSDMGGINPLQVGLGTRVASIQTLWAEGSLQQTGVSTDVAIQGNGFLVTKNNGNQYLTRAGNLTFDSAGNLTDQNGGLIQGFGATVQYNQTEINSQNGGAGTLVDDVTPLYITNAQLTVNNTNLSAATNIQINPNFVEPASATNQLNFIGNLDSFQQSQAGVTNLGQGIPAAAGVAADPATLPFAMIINVDGGFPAAQDSLNPNKMTWVQGVGDAAAVTGGPASLHIVNDLATGQDPNDLTHTTPVITQAVSLAVVQNPANATGEDFAWNQEPPVTPALTSAQTVYDSTGTAHTVTTVFYQVTDISTNGVNPSPQNQVAYAWYSFDTTGGAAISTANLLGGTGIYEGSATPVAAQLTGYDRGTVGNSYWGDLIYFNSDGSLASTGGAGIVNGNLIQTQSDIYLPAAQPAVLAAAPGVAPDAADPTMTPVSPIPTLGAEIMQIKMNFGTAGFTQGPGVDYDGVNLQTGVPDPDTPLPIGAKTPGTIIGAGRDGLFSDAEGTYQVINGANTYVANSYATTTQNGYADGTLQSLSFNAVGTIEGQFSNGQTTALGQLLMASVENVNGLDSVGNNYYTEGPNAGAQILGTAGTNGMGTIEGGYLEGSNVDLTTELSNMIIAQRGFDVNSRVISVENANLQVLTQLGQGG